MIQPLLHTHTHTLHSYHAQLISTDITLCKLHSPVVDMEGVAQDTDS